jgi:hypothetical protein
MSVTKTFSNLYGGLRMNKFVRFEYVVVDRIGSQFYFFKVVK